MGKILVYAEKPDMGRTIAAALETKTSKFKQSRSHWENDEYVVTWGFGHLVSSKQPSDYKEFTEQPSNGWSWDAIPFYPPSGQLDYKKNPSSAQQLDIVSQLFKRADIDECINACDAGREGELIFWAVYDFLKIKKPVKRLWISDLTESSILKGFDNLRNQDFYISRREAAYARQFADWSLGMNLTVAFTLKGREVSNGGKVTLHVGRVQTPTIAILVNRRKEIENFVAQDYFEIEAEFGNKYKGMWFKNQLGNTRFEKEEDAKAVVDKITGKNGTVVKKDVKEEKENHPLLYNLGLLQKEANKKFGFSAQKTLDIAQVLYEKYKITTYPRTSSQYLTTEYVAELDDTLKAVDFGDYSKFVNDILNKGVKTTSRFVNDKEVQDHHAIVPTKKKPNLASIKEEKFSSGEYASADDIKKIFDLVVKRFLSVFYPAAVYEKTEIVTEVEQETFKTSGKILISAGWKEIYGADSDGDEEEDTPKKAKKGEQKPKVAMLPPISKGEVNPVTNIDKKAKKTQPPKHYTEGELIGVMENPKKFLDDKELIEALKEGNDGKGAGLGTEATRGPLIKNIIKRGYVTEEGKGKVKSLVATDLAMKLIDIAPEELKSPEITAEWEQKLKFIEEMDLERDEFEKNIREFVKQNIISLKDAKLEISFNQASGDDVVVGKCPKCGGDVVKRKTAYICVNSTQDNFCFGVRMEIAGKKISELQVKHLLSKGETGEMKGFKNKEGKTFSAKLIIKDGDVSFAFPSSETKETDMTCPVCQGKMIDRGTYVTCENRTKENECFAVYKTIASKKLTDKQVEQLVTKGSTDTIKGFKSKAGKDFSAKLKRNGIKVEFEFDNTPKQSNGTSVTCPFCGGTVTENNMAFGCSNWKEKECKFTVWKSSSKKLTIKQIEKLIQSGKTDTIDDLKSKKGPLFTAYFELDKTNKKVEMKFSN